MAENNRIVVIAPFSSDWEPLLDLLARDGFATERFGGATQLESLLDADGQLPRSIVVDANPLSDVTLFGFLDFLFSYCLIASREVPTLSLLVDPAALDPAKVNQSLNARVDQLVDRDLDPERMARSLTLFLSEDALWPSFSDSARLGLPESSS